MPSQRSSPRPWVPRNAVNPYVTQSHLSSAKRLVRKGLGCARIRVPHEPLISNSQVEPNQRSASTIRHMSACIGYLGMVPSRERFE